MIPGVDQVQGEEQLIQSAQAGDSSAFEALYRSHLGRVYALCRRLSDSSEEAEDMTQEAFIRAWQNLGSFQGRSRFGSWLHRVAVNVVLNARRVKGRSLALEALPENPPAPGASRAARPTYGREDLEAAMRCLPEGARIVFVLHDVYGYVHSEIGKLAGCSVGTSKAQLHRARRLLREVLER